MRVPSFDNMHPKIKEQLVECGKKIVKWMYDNTDFDNLRNDYCFNYAENLGSNGELIDINAKLHTDKSQYYIELCGVYFYADGTMSHYNRINRFTDYNEAQFKGWNEMESFLAMVENWEEAKPIILSRINVDTDLFNTLKSFDTEQGGRTRRPIRRIEMN